jgi:D-beta-D-heptose 7-phosphate kinase/D-beta-D-heptose 1-phosphate adenosyltransferase
MAISKKNKKAKVLIIGDACEDVYVYGHSTRLAPEAPVPVFIKDYEKRNGGMALNVYNNLSSLGVECDIIHNTNTVEKTRYVDEASNHLFIRVDTGDNNVKRIEKKYLSKQFLKKYDAIVISDYDKGFLNRQDIETICYRHPFTFMDTKKSLGRWCKDCKWIKINEKEFNETQRDLEGIEHIFDEKLIVTLGSKGCAYNGELYSVDKVEIKDLSGAGDTFLSGFVCKYLETKEIDESLIFANKCATIVVQQKGVNIVNGI